MVEDTNTSLPSKSRRGGRRPGAGRKGVPRPSAEEVLLLLLAGVREIAALGAHSGPSGEAQTSNLRMLRISLDRFLREDKAASPAMESGQ